MLVYGQTMVNFIALFHRKTRTTGNIVYTWNSTLCNARKFQVGRVFFQLPTKPYIRIWKWRFLSVTGHEPTCFHSAAGATFKSKVFLKCKASTLNDLNSKKTHLQQRPSQKFGEFFKYGSFEHSIESLVECCLYRKCLDYLVSWFITSRCASISLVFSVIQTWPN